MTGGPPERLLLVRLSAMGDVLQTLPALARLRAARPEAEIGWAVERRFAGLLGGHPAIDRLFVLERVKGGGLLANAGALRRLAGALRAWRPDAAVDLQSNLRSALVSRLSGARRRISLPRGEAREGAAFLATECVAPATEASEHRADRALRLVLPLLGTSGIAAGADAAAETALLPPVPASARETVKRALGGLGGSERPFVLFVAGTSEFGAFKRWPAEHFGDLARRMSTEAGLPVLVGYGPGQEPLATAITEASGGTARLAPATGSLQELRALLDEAALVVGADSGPVVLAGMAGRPTVALFGPKDPLVYAPRGPATVVVWKGVYCSPCRLRRCGDPICMTEMGADEAWEGARRALRAAEVASS